MLSILTPDFVSWQAKQGSGISTHRRVFWHLSCAREFETTRRASQSVRNKRLVLRNPDRLLALLLLHLNLGCWGCHTGFAREIAWWRKARLLRVAVFSPATP